MRSTDLAVLYAMRQVGDQAWGAEIYDKIRLLTSGISNGDVYVVLEGMEDRGMLHSQFEDPDPEKKKRPRKYYRFSEKGEQIFEAAIAADPELNFLSRQPLLLKPFELTVL